MSASKTLEERVAKLEEMARPPLDVTATVASVQRARLPDVPGDLRPAREAVRMRGPRRPVTAAIVARLRARATSESITAHRVDVPIAKADRHLHAADVLREMADAIERDEPSDDLLMRVAEAVHKASLRACMDCDATGVAANGIDECPVCEGDRTEPVNLAAIIKRVKGGGR